MIGVRSDPGVGVTPVLFAGAFAGRAAGAAHHGGGDLPRAVAAASRARANSPRRGAERGVVLLQRLDLHVAEEDRGATVFALQADVAFGGQLGHGAAEPLGNVAAIGVLGGGGPLFDVGLRDELAVEQDADERTLGGDGHAVPFAGFLDRLRGRREPAEESAAEPGLGCLGPFPQIGVTSLDSTFD